MTDRIALASPPRARDLTLGTVFEAWRGLTPIQLRATFLFGVALLVYQMAFGQAPPGVDGTLIMLVLDQIKVFALLLAVVVADRATGKDANRRGIYAIAVVAGSVAGALVATPTAGFLLHTFMNLDGPGLGGGIVYNSFELLILGGATVWIRNSRGRAELARARMQSAELERIAAAKQTVESELQAMQARVEPQFLFNTLAQVKNLYADDLPRGECMLDELIAYLRAAMPRMRDTSSTVGQEIELARAYLAIVKVRLGDRLGFDIELPSDLVSARMPPMMLLPLIDHAVVHGLDPLNGSGSIRIAIQDIGARLRLTITNSSAGFVSDTGVADIRERLRALYGDDARLDLDRADQARTRTIMNIPYEQAATSK